MYTVKMSANLEGLEKASSTFLEKQRLAKNNTGFYVFLTKSLATILLAKMISNTSSNVIFFIKKLAKCHKKTLKIKIRKNEFWSNKRSQKR